MIPKIIHYVWVGPKPIPDADRRRIEVWREKLPDWEFIWWNNKTVDLSSTYIRQAYAAQAWNRVSDYSRMDALCKYGGVYLDTDVDLVKPLEPLLNQSAFLGFQMGDELPDEMVNGAIFGARAGHWLPVTVRKYFNEKSDGRINVGSFSGPGLLTKLLREKGLNKYSDLGVKVEDVTIYPRAYFYPYSWREAYSESVITPDTYAVHRWSEGWHVKQPRLFSRRLKRKSVTLLARYAPWLAFQYAVLLASSGRRKTGA